MNSTKLSGNPVRLTSFSHGGGCGCKVAPGVLSEILRGVQNFPVPKELMVGIETADDAAVYRLNDEQALIATTDFFMPIVDDPYDFGRIAATNAISDVYAMGGTPIMALALVGMPLDKLPLEVIGKILEGGESVCAAAGIPIAGGHTIDSVEPIYGLVVMGLVHPDRVKTNADAQSGDVLILGKPLGVGVLSAALKKGALDAAGYDVMIASTTRLNTPGRRLAHLGGVHAMTDITGFGLLGHLLEVCRGAKLSAYLGMSQIPLLADVERLATVGYITGASARNWTAYGEDVALEAAISPMQRALLTDPQTSGGLLVACQPAAVDEVLEVFRAEGFAQAAVIGLDAAADGAAAEAPEAALAPAPRIVAQVHATYILVEVADGLLIVDQHSAHERVLYERVMRTLSEGGGPSQQLLFPLTIEFAPAELDAIEANRELVARLGYALEPFGGRALIVHAVPAPHPRFEAERCLRELVADLAGDRFGGLANRLERFASTFACRAAIKAGHALTRQEMEELVDRLFASALPAHDVHGRPTIVQLPRHELERRFGRR